MKTTKILARRFGERIRALAVCQQGTTAIEYGLIAAMIALAALGGIKAVSQSLETQYNTVQDSVGSVL